MSKTFPFLGRSLSDELPTLCKKISKEGQGTVLFDDNPAKLVEKILAELSKT